MESSFAMHGHAIETRQMQSETEATQRKSNANRPMLGCSDAVEWIECTNDRKFHEETPYGGSED